MKLSIATVLAQAVATCFAATQFVHVTEVVFWFDSSGNDLVGIHLKINDQEGGTFASSNIKGQWKPCGTSEFDYNVADYFRQGSRYSFTLQIKNRNNHFFGQHNYPNTIACGRSGAEIRCHWDAIVDFILAG